MLICRPSDRTVLEEAKFGKSVSKVFNSPLPEAWLHFLLGSGTPAVQNLTSVLGSGHWLATASSILYIGINNKLIIAKLTNLSSEWKVG